MGDFGKIDAAAYEHNRMTARRVEKLETAVAAWLATKPGAFTSRDACEPYDKALAQFKRHSGGQDTRDNFEVALARLGYRAGCVTFNGEPRWVLILPSSLDTALDRMAATESHS